ncbi:hypothetical protein JVW21_21475, partial [Vibrio cholerae O1]|uniref:hypothetical protein n=1 Tax=Vibrio cholerae TaxID=666 RepID=UPI001C0FB46E
QGMFSSPQFLRWNLIHWRIPRPDIQATAHVAPLYSRVRVTGLIYTFYHGFLRQCVGSPFQPGEILPSVQ